MRIIHVIYFTEDKSAGTSPDTSLALLQTELAKVEEQSEVLALLCQLYFCDSLMTGF